MFIIDRFPALQESTMIGASSIYKERRGTSRLHSMAPESEKDSSPKILKRTRSEPPKQTRGGIKKLHRANSVARQVSVKFSSCSEHDEFGITSAELQDNPQRFKRESSVKLTNGVNLNKTHENDQEVVKNLFQHLKLTYIYIFNFSVLIYR